MLSFISELTCLFNQSFNQSMNQSIEQSINQSLRIRTPLRNNSFHPRHRVFRASVAAPRGRKGYSPTAYETCHQLMRLSHVPLSGGLFDRSATGLCAVWIRSFSRCPSNVVLLIDRSGCSTNDPPKAPLVNL